MAKDEKLRTLTRVNTPPKLKGISQKHKNPGFFPITPETILKDNKTIVHSTVLDQEKVANFTSEEYYAYLEKSGTNLPTSDIFSLTKDSIVKVERVKLNSKQTRSEKVISPKTAAQPNQPRSHETTVIAKDKYFETGVYTNELLDNGLDEKIIQNIYTSTASVIPLGKRVFLNEKPIALFKYGDKYYAFSDICCHQGGLIHNGRIADIEEIVSDVKRKRLCVICPRHNWKFDVNTGERLEDSEYVQKVYKCKVDPETNEIKVAFDDISPTCFESEDF